LLDGKPNGPAEFQHYESAIGLQYPVDFTQTFLQRLEIAHAERVDVIVPDVAAVRATVAAHRAIEIDTGLAQPWATLGFVSESYVRQRGEAERFLCRAIELDPSYAPAHQWLSALLLRSNREAEAREHSQIARTLDPLSGVVHVTDAHAMLYLGQPEGAFEELEGLRAIGLQFWQVDLILGIALSLCGRHAEAVAAASRALDTSGGTVAARAVLARALAGAGRIRESRDIVSALERESRARWVPPTQIAFAYLALGEFELAIERLVQAGNTMDPYFVYFDGHSIFHPVREDPRYRAARAASVRSLDLTSST
jgi:tetratricopeptide (TPR) repeat protein